MARRREGQSGGGLGGSLRAALVFVGVPVYLFLRKTVEHLVSLDLPEVIPCPLDERLDLGARRREQGCVHADPGGEGDGALQFMTMGTDFGDGGTAADHGHDALVEIIEGGA